MALLKNFNCFFYIFLYPVQNVSFEQVHTPISFTFIFLSQLALLIIVNVKVQYYNCLVIILILRMLEKGKINILRAIFLNL